MDKHHSVLPVSHTQHNTHTLSLSPCSTAPPHVIDTEEISVTHRMGSPLKLQCGIALGPISRRREYTVQWQRVSSSVKIISSCTYRGPGTGDTTDSPQEDCHSGFDLEDFSLLQNVIEPDSNGLAKFKCLVAVSSQPLSSPLAPEIRDVDTVVTLYGESKLKIC